MRNHPPFSSRSNWRTRVEKRLPFVQLLFSFFSAVFRPCLQGRQLTWQTLARAWSFGCQADFPCHFVRSCTRWENPHGVEGGRPFLAGESAMSGQGTRIDCPHLIALGVFFTGSVDRGDRPLDRLRGDLVGRVTAWGHAFQDRGIIPTSPGYPSRLSIATDPRDVISFIVHRSLQI
jgi:hypothetical protein